MSPNAALALADEPRATTSSSPSSVTVPSEVLGELAVPADSVLTFPTGLFGFPECRRFALVPAGRDGLYWLQSLEHSTLAFLLADPFQFFRGYAVELTAGDRLELGAQGAADVAILAIVTLPQGRGTQPTANLQGPLALNLRAGIGRQLAIANGDWGVRCAFEP
ncbi:MAG TPA: flagellar assembly protein FliW [Gemmatimonadales bacterium]